jgi:hypothetical protein
MLGSGHYNKELASFMVIGSFENSTKQENPSFGDIIVRGKIRSPIKQRYVHTMTE